MSLTYRIAPKRAEEKKLRVHIWRFDNLLFFYFGAKMLVINGKWLIIKGVKKIIVQHPAHFWPFWKAPEEKLMPYSLISFKSWLNNVDSNEKASF